MFFRYACLFCFFLTLSFKGFALANAEEVPLEALETRHYFKKEQKRIKSSYGESPKASSSWDVEFIALKEIAPKKNVFFRADIGLGLLYFSQVRGNLSGLPDYFFSSQAANAPIKNRLMYNRTPLYEFQLGYQFNPYLKVALAYVHQGDVTLQTKKIRLNPALNVIVFADSQLTANLNLDAFLLKAYTQAPWPMVIKNISTNLYLGSGLGAGWQSYSNIWLNTVFTGVNYTSFQQPIRSKTSANVVWMNDVGLQFQKASKISPFSILMGIKFNIWGQARNIGKMSSQDSFKYAIFKPLTIKTVYQWAPYLSVQWNFPEEGLPTAKECAHRIETPLLTQANVGIGFLYFRKIRGNLVSLPNQNGINNLGWNRAYVTQEVSYNRTPLFEYLVQYQLNPYFQWGVSYQNQAGISFQTKAVPSHARFFLIGDYMMLTSYLNLNAILWKSYFKYPLFKESQKVRVFPYVGLGFGPGWQSWTRIYVERSAFRTQPNNFIGGAQFIRQKIVANPVVNVDLGLQLMTLNDKTDFSLVGGCKFNYWGQARNIGKQSQQGSYSLAINAPFIIQKVYQWAPYLGVQWNFPKNTFSKKAYYLDGRLPNAWTPYFVDGSLMQKKESLITQFNVGLGTLRFRGIQGNLSCEPSLYFNNLERGVPIKGKLSHNNTPLYEYLLGYRFLTYFKALLSYQHQGHVTIQTQPLVTFSPDNIYFANKRAWFTSDLVLDSLMIKVYYELPKSLVWRSLVYTPYCALATGAVWQTWKNAAVNFMNVGGSGSYPNEFEAGAVNLRQKVSSSLGFMVDTGLRVQAPYPGIGFSALLGLKFNFWGQARNIGKTQNQLFPRTGLYHPFRIKTLYQWAPYLGVQWSF